MHTNVQKTEEFSRMTFVDYGMILWKRRLLFLILTLSTAVAAVIVSISSIFLPNNLALLPKKFKASAIVQVKTTTMLNQSEKFINSNTLDALAELANINTEAKEKYALLVLMLKNRLFLDEAAKNIAEEKLKENKTGKANIENDFIENIEVKKDQDALSIIINYESVDEEHSLKVVNSILDLLNERLDEFEQNDSKRKLEILNYKMQQVNNSIYMIEKELKDYLTKNAVNSMEKIDGLADFEYERMKQRLYIQYDINNTLTRQYEFEKLKSLRKEPLFEVIEKPKILNVKSGLSKLKFVLSSVIGSIFFTIVLISVLEYLNRVKSDPIEMGKIKNYKKVE